jgi:hypothetical protein
MKSIKEQVPSDRDKEIQLIKQIEDCIPGDECNVALRSHWVSDITTLIENREKLVREECENNLKYVEKVVNIQDIFKEAEIRADERRKVEQEFLNKLKTENANELWKDAEYLIRENERDKIFAEIKKIIEFMKDNIDYDVNSEVIEKLENLKQRSLKNNVE